MKQFHDFGNSFDILNNMEQRMKCPVLEECRTIAGTNQHLNEQDSRGHFGNETREPFKKIQKNHPALDFIGDPEECSDSRNSQDEIQKDD